MQNSESKVSQEQNGRCSWCGNDPLYVAYHDQVWGRPVSNSQELFEKLCLDGQQAGLSWITILRKQENYRAAFADFDPAIIAGWGDVEVEALLGNAGIVRNRLKINSILKNARAFLRIEESGIEFNEFLWRFLDGRPIVNEFKTMQDIPANTSLSDVISKELKKRGFSFVGTTIVYAFMQAVGMVNDHLVTCPQHSVCRELAADFELVGGR